MDYYLQNYKQKTMNNLITLNYWFNMRAGELTNAAQWILIFFIVMLAIFYIISYIYSKKKGLYFKIANRIKSFTITNGTIGLVLLFFTYEAIPFLSMRFWFMVWFISMIIWLVFIIRNLLQIPKLKEALEKEREFKKYIP